MSAVVTCVFRTADRELESLSPGQEVCAALPHANTGVTVVHSADYELQAALLETIFRFTAASDRQQWAGSWFGAIGLVDHFLCMREAQFEEVSTPYPTPPSHVLVQFHSRIAECSSTVSMSAVGRTEGKPVCIYFSVSTPRLVFQCSQSAMQQGLCRGH